MDALTHDIALTTQVRIAGVLREEHVTADLYRPLAEGRVPAAAFTSGSGGVGSAVELYYARVLARQGMASLVIDSFQPRGVLRTSQDQTVVRMQQQTADAVAGFRWLAAQPNIDPTRIVVIGLSRGGTVATDLALEQRRRAQHQLQSSEVRFAAHVGIAPDCVWQLKDARTTGAPIYFVLSEFDEFTPGCIDYADRIRAAGNPNVRIAVYPGVYHVLEATGGPVQVNDIRDAKCTGRYLFDTDFTVIDRANGRRVALPKDSEQLWREKCAELRDHINGGDLRIRAQATEDLLQFLRDIEILIDAKARAVVPDCKSIPEDFFRLNCARARSGWVGDLVALGQAFRTGRLPRDPILARRLFGLAAERGHSTAQAALANMYLDGDGGPRDFAAAHSYAQLAAAADEQGGMNALAVMARDGGGQRRDEAEALKWFQKSADLRNPFALAELGRMHWFGRGGIAVDRAAAVKLYRFSAFYGNPWGCLYLAEALELGEGTARNIAEAIDLYRAAAGQDQAPAAKGLAQDALVRLGATATKQAR